MNHGAKRNSKHCVEEIRSAKSLIENVKWSTANNPNALMLQFTNILKSHEKRYYTTKEISIIQFFIYASILG